MKTKIKLLLFVSLFVSPAFANSDTSYYGYDQIVNDLSRSTSRVKTSDDDPLDNIEIHSGLGFTTSYVSIDSPGVDIHTAFLKGVQLSLGIDLFSRNWAAEGTMRSFGRENLEERAEISLKEFDLRFTYRDKFTRRLGFKTGVGVAARYLNFNYHNGSTWIKTHNTTPSSVFVGTIEAYLSPSISIGTEMVYRSALVEDTIDKSALDANLRIDAHF